MVAITVRTADLDDDGSGNDDPIVVETAVHIEISGLDPWTADPQMDDPFKVVQDVYRLVAQAPTGDDGASHAFTASADGDHVWDGYIFPVVGSWTLNLYSLDEDGELDSSEATQAVTVVAQS